MQALSQLYHRYFLPTKTTAADHLQRMPIEIILHIFSYLNHYDLLQMGRTCHVYHDITRDHTLAIAERRLWKQKVSVRVTQATSNESFNLYQNKLFAYRPTLSQETLELIDLDKKSPPQKIETFDIAKTYIWHCLEDYYFFVQQAKSLFIKFIPKSDPTQRLEYNLSTLFGINHIMRENVVAHRETNTLILYIQDHLLMFKNGLFLHHILPLEYPDPVFAFVNSFHLAGDHLIVNYTISRHYSGVGFFTRSLPVNEEYLQIRYSVTTGQLVASHGYPRPMNGKILQVLVSDRYITTLLEMNNRNSIHVDVRDHQFRSVSNFNLPIIPNVKCRDDDDMEFVDFGDECIFYTYEDRLVVFVNDGQLCIFDLKNGGCLLSKNFGDNLNRNLINCKKDLVAIASKHYVNVYCIKTAKLVRRTRSNRKTVWVEFAKPNHLLYTTKNESNNSKQYFQLAVKPKIAKPRIKSREVAS